MCTYVCIHIHIYIYIFSYVYVDTQYLLFDNWDNHWPIGFTKMLRVCGPYRLLSLSTTTRTQSILGFVELCQLFMLHKTLPKFDNMFIKVS